VRSPHAAHAHADTVTRSTAAWWGLASGKVLPVSTGGVPGWQRAGGVEVGLTLVVAQRAGVQQGVGAGAVVGVGGEGAPVSSGAVDGRQGRELQVWYQGIEGKSWHGGESSADGGRVPLFFKRGLAGEGAEGVRWGSGSAADAWRKRGHEQGGPYRPVDDAQPTATRDRWVRVMCAVRAWPTEQRGRGEADRWAAGIVPGGGTDRQADPS
jgi:hypothetical protein